MDSSAGGSRAQKNTTGNTSYIKKLTTGFMDFGLSKAFKSRSQSDRSGQRAPADPQSLRFSELKKTIWKDSMTQSWAQVLDALKDKVEQIESMGSRVGNSVGRPFVCAKFVTLQAVPSIHYNELQKGLSDERIAEIKEAGVVIVRGAVPKEVRHRTCISSGIHVNVGA